MQNFQQIFYTPQIVYTIMFLSFITVIHDKVLQIGSLVVVYLLDAQIKWNLKGFYIV